MSTTRKKLYRNRKPSNNWSPDGFTILREVSVGFFSISLFFLSQRLKRDCLIFRGCSNNLRILWRNLWRCLDMYHLPCLAMFISLLTICCWSWVSNLLFWAAFVQECIYLCAFLFCSPIIFLWSQVYCSVILFFFFSSTHIVLDFVYESCNSDL